MFDVEKIKVDVKKAMSFKRYEHSLLVAEEAKKLAKTYQYDEDKAYITGLCHDIAKELTDEENKYFIQKYKIDDSIKKIIHADIGSIICKEKYGFTDEMCQAIKSHTIGNEDMTLLDKIIFIADKIGRKDLSSFGQELKNVAYKDLDLSIYLYLEKQQQKFKDMGQELHPVTLHLLKKLHQKTN